MSTQQGQLARQQINREEEEVQLQALPLHGTEELILAATSSTVAKLTFLEAASAEHSSHKPSEGVF